MQMVTSCRLKLLAAIMDSYPPVTIQRLGELVGVTNNAVYCTIARLERDGLITQERLKRCTIRPAVRFIAAENLGPELRQL